MLEEKIKEAEKTLKLAAAMSRDYYHEPLIICYSGGKDSDVLLDIAIKCLKRRRISGRISKRRTSRQILYTPEAIKEWVASVAHSQEQRT